MTFLFRSSAAHIIAKFTRKALLGEIPRAPSKNVIGAYLYICRQLYNTCEGLLVLYQYDLHNVVVGVWKQVSLLFLTLLSSEVPFSWKIIHVSKSII
jgi:hypothetical protein